jgi:hypothetical protein
VPFDFLRRWNATAPDATHGAKRRVTSIAFDGMTEEWHLVGRMEATGRLSDVLNRREPIAITDVQWAPIDGSGEFSPVPGLKSVDPYDLILVLAGEGSVPALSDGEKAAYKVHKVEYDVALEVPPFRVVGTVFLFPGSEPERLLDRATEMFVPVVGAVATLADRTVTDPEIDAILVNRFYLRGVEEIDKRTGEKPQRLPGAPLGGTSWHERSR